MVFLAACSAVVLLLKLKKLKAQEKYLLLDPFSGEDGDGEKIRPRDIDRLRSRIQDRFGDYTRSFLLNRLVRGMENFRQRGDVQQVRTVLEAQGDLDATAVDSSYTIYTPPSRTARSWSSTTGKWWARGTGP